MKHRFAEIVMLYGPPSVMKPIKGQVHPSATRVNWKFKIQSNHPELRFLAAYILHLWVSRCFSPPPALQARLHVPVSSTKALSSKQGTDRTMLALTLIVLKCTWSPSCLGQQVEVDNTLSPTWNSLKCQMTTFSMKNKHVKCSSKIPYGQNPVEEYSYASLHYNTSFLARMFRLVSMPISLAPCSLQGTRAQMSKRSICIFHPNHFLALRL